MKKASSANSVDSEKISRRTLIDRSLRLFAGACLCGKAAAASDDRSTCCYTPALNADSYQFDENSVTVDLARSPALASYPGAAYLIDQDRGVQLIIVRLARRKFAAFSRLCTHASQVISFVEKRGLLQCNGFNHSTFDLEGKVYKGPAEKALTKYAVELRGQTLRIELKS